ncbi:MAG: hypothetical protein GX029_11015 [Pseudomonadaceae bacterium]|nr:hypothetical protein [Pseudomonadaceae bacterium]
MQNKKRIPVSDNVAYTHWEMPDLTGVKRRIAQRLNELKKEEQQQEEPLVEPAEPTPEELAAQAEQEREESRAAGFAEGLAAGQEEGQALGYQEGEKAGQETGFQTGYKQGLDQAEQEVDQQLARLQSLIEQLQGPVAALDMEVENALLSLVDLVCRAILRREVKLERAFLAEVLQEAVAALPVGHQRLRIFLNPEDLNLAEAACKDLLEDYRLVGDPEVTLGGVRVETLQSLVDSTLESRYKKIIDKLLGGVYQPAAENLVPLADEILDTPDTPPLAAAEFSKPELATESTTEEAAAVEESKAEESKAEESKAEESKAEEPELEPELPPEEVAAEPVAQVSLQRGKAPRHELPQEEVQAEAAVQPENIPPATNLKPELSPEPKLEPAPQQTAEPALEDFNLDELVADNLGAEESPDLEEDFTELKTSPPPEAPVEPLAEVAAEQKLEETSDDLDLFPEFNPSDSFETVDELAGIFDEPVAASDVSDHVSEEVIGDWGSAASEVADKNESETAPAAVEKDWSPETVHDDRYVDDALDNLEIEADNDALDVIDDDLGGLHG